MSSWRAQLLMHTMEDPVTDLVEKGNEAHLKSYLAKIAADERLLAILGVPARRHDDLQV